MHGRDKFAYSGRIAGHIISLLGAVALGGGASYGCSVINSFDDLVEAQPDAGAGGSSGSSGSGGMAGAGGTGGTSGSGGSSGAGSMAGGGGAVQDGVIVIADGTNDLVVLSPWTGGELARETMDVAAIGYEEERDVWFIFERGSAALDPATLHVRQWSLQDEQWSEQAPVQVPAVFAQGTLATLNRRIYYKSTVVPTGGGPPSNGVTLLDTGDLSAVRVLGNDQEALPNGDFIGLIPKPNPGSSAGGTINLVQKGACNATGDGGPNVCDIGLLNVTITSDPNPQYKTTNKVGAVPESGGNAAWTFDRINESDVMIFPPPDPSAMNPEGSLRRFNPFTNAPQGDPIPFSVAGPRINDADFDACTQTALATELGATPQQTPTIFAIPLQSGGTVAQQSLSTPAQRVVFEPFTRTVIRPLDGGNPEISAFVLGGTETEPTFNRRLANDQTLPWDPPPVEPKIVVVKSTPACQ